MLSALLLAPLLIVSAAELDTKFEQVAPANGERFVRFDEVDRAVVLINGLRAHPFGESNVAKARFSDWQQPGSTLVNALQRDSDVFAFSYSQNLPVQEIVELASLDREVQQLRALGYREIVLVGHSAGGLIARQLVEDHPDCGVTKVVQVCTPNSGSYFSKLDFAVPASQAAFLESLGSQCRTECLANRADIKIPAQVEFVCLVGQHHLAYSVKKKIEFGDFTLGNVTLDADARGDGIISSGGQWTAELQDQGVPAIALPVTHFRAMQSQPGIAKVAELVRVKQPRLSKSEVAATRKRIFGSEAADADKAFAIKISLDL